LGGSDCHKCKGRRREDHRRRFAEQWRIIVWPSGSGCVERDSMLPVATVVVLVHGRNLRIFLMPSCFASLGGMGAFAGQQIAAESNINRFVPGLFPPSEIHLP
jgi:hypothetical protein